MNLKNYSFHDTLLKDIKIERDNPGYKDEISITISLSKENDIRVVFKDCFQANFSLNFGIIAEETIYDFYESDRDNKELEVLRNKWLKIGGDIKDVRLFIIETNSTNSLIKIFAKSCQIESLTQVS